MTDLSGLSSFGGGGFAFRTPPTTEKPAVAEVAKTSDDASTNSSTDQGAAGSKAEDALGERRIVASIDFNTAASANSVTATVEEIGPDTIPGPTPAFQASLLEIESDLKNVIAKIEAARTRETDEGAVSAEPPNRSAERPEAANDARPAARKRTDDDAPAAREVTPERAQAEPKEAKEGETFAVQTPYDVESAPTD